MVRQTAGLSQGRSAEALLDEIGHFIELAQLLSLLRVE
jgi:hypothetical protein